eukprot:3197051-Rhodomonas_salina.1
MLCRFVAPTKTRKRCVLATVREIGHKPWTLTNLTSSSKPLPIVHNILIDVVPRVLNVQTVWGGVSKRPRILGCSEIVG